MSCYTWLHHLTVKKVMELYFNRCFNGPPFQNQEDKKYEFQRLISFQNWPKESPIFPIKLAKAGFFYENNFDEVTCFHCGVKNSNWKPEDDPFETHRILNPECEFISEGSSENIPLSQESSPEETERLSRINRLLEIQEQSYFPYDCVVLGGEEAQTSQAEAALLSSYGDLSISHQLEDKNADQSETKETNMSKSKSDSPSKRIRTGSEQEARRSPVPNANVADAQVVPRSQEGNSPQSAARGNKAKPGKDSKKNPAGDLDVPPPTGNQLGPLRFERNRLETFKDWPSSDCVPPTELAKWGFYYTGAGDRVKCVFCKGILRNWEAGDRPHIEHRKHFPRCPLILGMKIGNVPLPLDLNASSATNVPLPNQQQSSNVSDSHSNMETLGIITERPKHPQYAVESQRLASFERWPPYKYQTPQKLANAGFWYAGFNDNVKCFYCNGGLRNWEPGDEPWVEHARWFPRCPFVKQVKGQEFINNVLREKGVIQGDPSGETPNPSAAATHNQGAVKFQVEEREIRARMDRPHVKMVQDMGYNKDLIMRTLRKRFAETGDDFPSATALLEGLFDMEEEESQSVAMSGADTETENQSANETADPQEVTEQSHLTPGEDQTVTTEKEEKEKAKDDENKENKEISETGELIKPDRDELEKENLELKEQRLCKICMTEQAAVVFLPCGHLVSCASCSPALQSCPICRAEIKGVVRTYMA